MLWASHQTYSFLILEWEQICISRVEEYFGMNRNKDRKQKQKKTKTMKNQTELKTNRILRKQVKEKNSYLLSLEKCKKILYLSNKSSLPWKLNYWRARRVSRNLSHNCRKKRGEKNWKNNISLRTCSTKCEKAKC